VVAEMLLAAASWYLAFSLAPDHAHGEYQAVWSAGIPVARCLGPLLLAAGLLHGGVLGWGVLGAVFLLAGAAAAARKPAG
jgi:hypothetical protein